MAPNHRSAAAPSSGRWPLAAAAAVAAAALAALTQFLTSGRHVAPALLARTLPPRPVYYALVALVDWLESLLRAITPPNLYLFRHVMAYLSTVEIYTAAQLGIADVLPPEGPPVLSAQLAAAVTPCSAQPSFSPGGCPAVAARLTRLLRALAALGIFRESAPEAWEHTPASLFLRADAEGSLRASALQFGGVQYQMMSQLPRTVSSGAASFRAVHGQEFWAFYESHPEEHAVFDATMRELGVLGGTDAAIAADYDWATGGAADTAAAAAVGRVIVDVGGGLGQLLHSIVATHRRRGHRNLSGVVFDLPSVVERAARHWERRHASAASVDNTGGEEGSPEERAAVPALVAGDMFDPATIPSRYSAAAAAAGELAVREVVEVQGAAMAAARRAELAAGGEGDAERMLSGSACDEPEHLPGVDDGDGEGNDDAGVAPLVDRRQFAYMLRDIIHDWPDEEVVRIFSALRSAMRYLPGVPANESAAGRSGGGVGGRMLGCTRVNFALGRGSDSPVVRTERYLELPPTAAPADATAPRLVTSPAGPDLLLLVTRVVEPGLSVVASEGASHADIVMLGAFGTTAGERTLPHLQALLAAGGFRFVRRVRVRGRYSVVEAVPA
jgi:hypothetical protein